MKYIFCLFLLVVPIFASHAQIKEEEQSGYKGGFIDSLIKPDGALSFIAIGDWGRNGQYYQQEVADQMGRATATLDAAFILAAGDNFYPSGVQSTQDPQWHYSYEAVYRSQFLQNEWYVALGNHDYKGNIQAEIAYSQISRRWRMPAPYYSKKIKLKGGSTLLLIVMDTNPFIDNYYGRNDEMGMNVAKQDTALQKKWMIKTLSDTDHTIKWKIVLAHHPMYSGGKRKSNPDTESIRRRFEQLFDQYNVDAFICGHEHDLQIIKSPDHYTTQFISGAGCEVRPTGVTEGSIFAASEPGFMAFSLTANEMLVQVINAQGAIIFNTTIRK